MTSEPCWQLTFPKIWQSWQIMMYTSQELMIYDIGYKTLGKFWSVKRMVIHTGLYHRQTQTCGNYLLHGLIGCRDQISWSSRWHDIPKPCKAPVFGSLWARESEVNNVRWKCPHHFNSDPRPVDYKCSRSNFHCFLEVMQGWNKCLRQYVIHILVGLISELRIHEKNT